MTTPANFSRPTPLTLATGPVPRPTPQEQRSGLFILMDHRVDDGEWLPFFGYQTQTATTPARLARRFGCPILLGLAILLSKNRYKISFYEPLRPAAREDEHADIPRMTRAINTTFESWIRRIRAIAVHHTALAQAPQRPLGQASTTVAESTQVSSPP